MVFAYALCLFSFLLLKRYFAILLIPNTKIPKLSKQIETALPQPWAYIDAFINIFKPIITYLRSF